MRSTLLAAMLTGLAVAQPTFARAEAFSDMVAETMGELEWGMSHTAVFKLIEERIRERYRPLVLDATGVIEQDRVMSQQREEIARVKRDFVVFDGRVSGWDVSAIGPEFRRNSAEAMLIYDDEQSKNHYFFIRGRLWKWYRQFKPEAFGGAGFDAVSQALMGRFGPAAEQHGKRLEGGGAERWVAWDGARTRVTAIDRGTHIVLLLTDLRVHGQLATLRKDALPRRPERKSTIDAILMTEAEREAMRNHEVRAER